MSKSSPGGGHPGGRDRGRPAIFAYPPEIRLRLRTPNDVERLNREIRRRERVIRSSPNRASAERLLGAVLMEQHEAWSTGRRYVNLKSYWATQSEPAVSTQNPVAGIA